MRIVVAHNYYQQGGGEDQCVAQEVEMLRGFGHDVLLFSLRNDSINGMGRAKLASATIWNRAAYAGLTHEIASVDQSSLPSVLRLMKDRPAVRNWLCVG